MTLLNITVVFRATGDIICEIAQDFKIAEVGQFLHNMSKELNMLTAIRSEHKLLCICYFDIFTSGLALILRAAHCLTLFVHLLHVVSS